MICSPSVEVWICYFVNRCKHKIEFVGEANFGYVAAYRMRIQLANMIFCLIAHNSFVYYLIVCILNIIDMVDNLFDYSWVPKPLQHQ